jgi:RHS repeat-associated protein
VNPGNQGALFFEKDIKPNGSVEQRAFINAGGQAVAIVKTATASGTTSTSTRYLHHDALGSVSAISNESGTVLERLSYEPFGKRRFMTGASDPDNTIVPLNTDRGFTGHEMLDEIGLIHMNGRVYDPLVGRFLSADPNIQSPGNLQSYNRYSYVMNNPLGYTDPSGYSWWTSIRNIVVRGVAAVADAYGCSGYCSAAVGAYQGYKSGGAAGAVVSGIGGYAGYQMSVFAPLTNQAGNVIWQNVATQAAVSGTIGCASASTAGGSCGQGALGSVAGVLSGTISASYGNNFSIQRVGVEAVAGGVVSVASGGSFKDGFLQAGGMSALTYLNYSMRQSAIANASLNPDNINGKSAGFFGDGIKMAGARRVIDLLTGRYTICDSTMGGCQGNPIGPYDTRSSFFGYFYDPGDLRDHINESFAGPHDWLRNLTGSYDAQGNGIDFIHTSYARHVLDETLNYALIPLAAPFAAAALVSPQTYGSLIATQAQLNNR